MAKSRPPHRPVPAASPTAADPLLAGHDLAAPEGEEAARRALYRWLDARARWIDRCEAEARRALGRPRESQDDIPHAAFIAASHALMRAGVEPTEGLDPAWFPPEVHAFLAAMDAGRSGSRRRGRRGRRTV